MEETQSTANPGTPIEQDEVSLLDMLVTLAENAKLLIIGPLLVGLCALGIGYTLPQSFTSQAHLNLGDSAKAVEAIMRSPVVLDMVLKQFPSPSGVTDRARDELANKFRFGTDSASKKTGAVVTKLEMGDESPARAQGLANALIDAWLATTKPQPESQLELMRKLKLTQNALETVSQLIKQMAGESTKLVLPNVQYELATPTVQLLQLRNGYVDAIVAIELQLRGQTRDVVVSPPTLPTQATKPKKAMLAIVATLATGLLLLLFIFMRQALRNTAEAAEAAGKLARIRLALGLKTRSLKR